MKNVKDYQHAFEWAEAERKRLGCNAEPVNIIGPDYTPPPNNGNYYSLFCRGQEATPERLGTLRDVREVRQVAAGNSVSQGGDNVNLYKESLRETVVSGTNVFTTQDGRIMVIQTMPGYISLFFKPYGFYPEAEELMKTMETVNRKFRAGMTMDLSNKGKGIIGLSYNPLSSTIQSVEKTIRALITKIYEYDVEDDEKELMEE